MAMSGVENDWGDFEEETGVSDDVPEKIEYDDVKIKSKMFDEADRTVLLKRNMLERSKHFFKCKLVIVQPSFDWTYSEAAEVKLVKSTKVEIENILSEISFENNFEQLSVLLHSIEHMYCIGCRDLTLTFSAPAGAPVGPTVAESKHVCPCRSLHEFTDKVGWITPLDLKVKGHMEVSHSFTKGATLSQEWGFSIRSKEEYHSLMIGPIGGSKSTSSQFIHSSRQASSSLMSYLKDELDEGDSCTLKNETYYGSSDGEELNNLAHPQIFELGISDKGHLVKRRYLISALT
jgi:hypothetical protein